MKVAKICLGQNEADQLGFFHEQLNDIQERLPGDIGSFEAIVFMFDLIVNAEDRDRTIKSFQKLIDYFNSMVKKEKNQASPVLLSHVLTALLEASDNQEEQLNYYQQVNALATQVYPADSFMLTKLKIQKCPIYVKAFF